MRSDFGADLSLVAGLVLLGLAGVNALARFADDRSLVVPATTAVFAAILIGWAEISSTSGYTPAKVPLALVRLIADFAN